MKTQDDLKKEIAKESAQWARDFCEKGSVLGVGTGSTVNFLIEALIPFSQHFGGMVASSLQTEARLKKAGFTVLDFNSVQHIPLYIDGADEINPSFQLIKGGGGALTREKILASASETFLCIADESKWVKQLGKFPLPFEVLPFAQSFVQRVLEKMGGEAKLREGFQTDNGNAVLDVSHLNLSVALLSEVEFNQIPGVVENGIFARRPADFVLLSGQAGVFAPQKIV